AGVPARGEGGACSGAAACSARLARTSKADSRFSGVSYLPPTGERERTLARSSSLIVPMRQRGGQIRVRCTGMGTPLSCSVDTRASPTASSPITRATSSFGLGTKVAELAQHLVRHVIRVLRAEIDPHALGADQPHHLLDPLPQRWRAVVEQQVRLVEEEHQLRYLQVTDLGQVLEQLAQQPEQEAGI